MRLSHIAPTALLGSLLLVAAADPAASSPTPTFASEDLAAAALVVGQGGHLRLAGVEEEGSRADSAFVLERFEVFTPDATVTITAEGGKQTVVAAPATRYFRGTVEGEPESHVFLSVLESGAVEGIVRRASGIAFIGSDDAPQSLSSGPLRMVAVTQLALDTASGQEFGGTDDELEPPPSMAKLLAEQSANSPLRNWAAVPLTAPMPTRTARVAIETDFEFYSLFNNPTTATNYIANLIGYDSAVAYIPELGTSLQVSKIFLWSTASDPWTQTGTTCSLAEFGNYWNNAANGRTSVSRTIAHFLSGKSLGGGIAWVGVLCSGAFEYSQAQLGVTCNANLPASGSFGGGYGFTANISSGFSLNNPSIMWESLATAHEIGHNFSSPHTHCYNGIGGNTNPIDACAAQSGCNTATTSLPGPNSLTGAGKGTIMSYCHLIGGLGAISMTFGAAPGFNDGIQPGREAAKMNSYIAGTGTCLVPVSGPSIVSISPAIGTTAGGQLVTIIGSGFVAPATVTLAGSAATSVAVVNSTTITAVTPAHSAAVVTVVVANGPSGSPAFSQEAVLLNGYTYSSAPLAPVVTSVSPPSGPLSGGTVVTIKGNNFVSGATATFAGAPAVATAFVNSSTLTATAPANTTGVKSVTVTNLDGSNGTLANGFFYANPSSAGDFFTLPACRLVDTRQATGPLAGPVLAAQATRTFTLAGACGVPAGAKAVSINITAVTPGAAGSLALYPGNAFPLGTSAVNFAAGRDRANGSVIELATDGAGTLGVQNASSGNVHVVIDVNGYFK